ncbi:MAG TPA: endonuclease/exonuclease/phosphatase family protein [Phycisphaerae bacterium]|nr:endonuclease/exonuclease/phosphatase family protein [Phycisphaerae bacterium]
MRRRCAVALVLVVAAAMACRAADRPRIAVMRSTTAGTPIAGMGDHLTALLSWRLRESGRFDVLPDIPAQGESGLRQWAGEQSIGGGAPPPRVLIPYVMMDDGYFQVMVVVADLASASRPATFVIDGEGGLRELARAIGTLGDRLAGEAALASPAQGAEGESALTSPPALKLTERMRAYRGAKAGVMTSTFIDRFDPRTVRLMNYNVNWDAIFPDVNERAAEKFQRLVKALDPDVLCLQEIREKSAEDVRALLSAISPLPNGATWHAYKGWTNVIASKYPLSLTGDRTVPPGERELAMALVDLPDERFKADLYVINNHWKCCGDTANDPQRQQMADAIANWIRDARTPGGAIDLPERTPLVICGDLNIVGGFQPVETLLTGDIIDERRYGPDFKPDWDGSALTDLKPRHNADGVETYTWRNDNDRWPPGRLDFIIFSDSLLEPVHSFVLNTTVLPPELLARTRLEALDVTLDDVGREYDHLPLVVDFRVLE